MRKIVLTTIFLMLSAGLMFGQGELNDIAQHDRLTYDPADSTAPYYDDNGVRTVKIAPDLDGDGKNEILATDYSQGGRVHVMEYNDGVLEIVWSTPPNAWDQTLVPRWVEYGDMDGDGNMEIIAPFGPNFEGEIQVWENVGDDDYGDEPAITLAADAFTVDGLGRFYTSRERGTVYDFDGDGMDELITANEDQNVYILSVNSEIPGPFASFEIEGGHPEEVDTNGFSGGSFWHAIPADINGDETPEIVNHYWNYAGYWNIEVEGEDSYTYPSQGNPDGGVHGPVYYEYYKDRDVDAVSFMGISAGDVDGNGTDEIFSVYYPNSEASLISFDESTSGSEIWTDQVFDSLLVDPGLIEFGESDSYWGNYAADLNQNGRDELLIGGFWGENVVSLEYTGSGDIFDIANYNIEQYYGGPKNLADGQFLNVTINDSAGVMDTSYSKASWLNPGVMKMSHGDVTGDDAPELAIAYQSNGYDSTEYKYRSWDADSSKYVVDSTVMRKMRPQVNIRLLSSTATGLKELPTEIVTPNDYKLEQNYPNPFNPTTSIRFSLPVNKQISLVVYDVLGREVKTLIDNKQMKKGSYEVTWDGTNNFGNEVASGTYIYRLEYGNFSKSHKMVFMK